MNHSSTKEAMGWGRAAGNVNSHMHRKVVRGSIMIEVCEVMN